MQLRDLKEVFPQMINVTEAYDSRFSSVQWQEIDGSQIAHVELDGEKFELLVEPATFKVDGKELTWLNIAFARDIDGKFSTELIGSTSNASAVIGTVSNALKDKIKELDSKFDIKAIGLAVRSGEEKRLATYKRFITSKIYGLVPWTLGAKVQFEGGTILVATKEKLTTVEYDALNKETAKHGKALI